MWRWAVGVGGSGCGAREIYDTEKRGRKPQRGWKGRQSFLGRAPSSGERQSSAQESGVQYAKFLLTRDPGIVARV